MHTTSDIGMDRGIEREKWGGNNVGGASDVRVGLSFRDVHISVGKVPSATLCTLREKSVALIGQCFYSKIQKSSGTKNVILQRAPPAVGQDYKASEMWT